MCNFSLGKGPLAGPQVAASTACAKITLVEKLRKYVQILSHTLKTGRKRPPTKCKQKVVYGMWLCEFM